MIDLLHKTCHYGLTKNKQSTWDIAAGWLHGRWLFSKCCRSVVELLLDFFFLHSVRVWLKLVVEVTGFSCSVTAEVNCFLHGIRLNRFYSPWLIKGGLKRFCHSLWTQWCRNRNNLYFLSVGKCSCTRSKVTGMSKHADSTESKNIK